MTPNLSAVERDADERRKSGPSDAATQKPASTALQRALDAIAQLADTERNRPRRRFGRNNAKLIGVSAERRKSPIMCNLNTASGGPQS
jgi:hypothetical protein